MATPSGSGKTPRSQSSRSGKLRPASTGQGAAPAGASSHSPRRAYSDKAKAAELGLSISTPKATANLGKKSTTKVSIRAAGAYPARGEGVETPAENGPKRSVRPAKVLPTRAPHQSSNRPKRGVAAKPTIFKRLNKMIADSGMCSRREADRWIAEGRVTVNGHAPNGAGQTVSNTDTVLVNGHPLPKCRPVVIAFHKPAGTLTTRSDERERRTIYDELPKRYQSCDPAGRLDRASSGLIIMSNDGDLLQKLMHPKYACPKVYRVHVNRPLTMAVAKQLKQGITLVDDETGAEQLAKAHQVVIEDEVTLTITLHTGLNRQIRRSLEALGYFVVTLRRLAVGPVQLKNLAVGKARELTQTELKLLKKLLG